MSDIVMTPTSCVLYFFMCMIERSESDQDELTLLIRSFVVWSCEHRDIIAPWVYGEECRHIVSFDIVSLYFDSWDCHADDLRTGIAPPLVCEDHLCKCTIGDLDIFCRQCHEYYCESCGYGCVCDER